MVRFELYESDGITLRYTFQLVQDTNYPQSAKHYHEITAHRGQGAIEIIGSDAPWDLTINGKFNASNYNDIMTAITELETALEFGEPYIIKIDKNTEQTEQDSYNVKRLQPIDYPPSLRNGHGFQEYKVILRANAW